ncbi:Uncharacterised protein [Achromobacter xylosoxidans]|nr:Uncharacterised protein [Achromobacter xylosoxidans]
MASAGAAPPSAVSLGTACALSKPATLSAAVAAMANAAGSASFAVLSAGAATRHSATAQNFSSGCCDTGSTASLVTALMQSSSPYTSFQCMDAKQLPGRTRSVTTAGSTARPRRERISTPSPAPMPSVAASSG